LDTARRTGMIVGIFSKIRRKKSPAKSAPKDTNVVFYSFSFILPIEANRYILLRQKKSAPILKVKTEPIKRAIQNARRNPRNRSRSQEKNQKEQEPKVQRRMHYIVLIWFLPCSDLVLTFL
jgi:hypothetical protein